MKASKTILDAHATQLAEWETEKLTLAQMQERLAADGVKISLGRLSVYLSRQRSAREQMSLLKMIATGSAKIKEVEAEFAKNPAPELNTLVSLFRVLIFNLSTTENINPDLLDTATALTKTALDFEKLAVKRAELALSEEKFALLKTQAERAGETEKALDAELTPAQREQRIKEIYGRT